MSITLYLAVNKLYFTSNLVEIVQSSLHCCMDNTINIFFLLQITIPYTVLWCRLFSERNVQSSDWMEPLQQSVSAKHTNGWLIVQQTVFYCTIIHRLIAMDKTVLHNAACYSIQEQSGAPPHVLLLNLWVSLWLMCNWLDEWVSHSMNPSKYCLIKRPLRLWLKTSKISFI